MELEKITMTLNTQEKGRIEVMDSGSSSFGIETPSIKGNKGFPDELQGEFRNIKP